MKIVVTARTLNEERNVNRFCESYKWADEIVIADGGSSDDTLSLLRGYDNTVIYHFTDRVWHTDTIWSNPRGKHVNFLIETALRHDADWIIFDDFDCVPTRDLQKQGRVILENCKENMVFAYRMFILGNKEWFPDMNRAGQSLYCWRAEVPVRADERNYTLSMSIPEESALFLEHPFSLLHYFYPDEETHQKKKAQYIATGEVTESYDPIRQFGRIEKLPSWATWR